MVKTRVEEEVISALEPLAAARGVDLVDVEVVGASKAPCVRVRLEALSGESVSLDDISRQSGWVSDALDDLDPLPGAYTLEVSSPGLDRPLRRPSDFARFVGERCELTTTATEGRRSYTGAILRSDDDSVALDVDGEECSFPFSQVKKCKLKPIIDFKGSKERN